MMTSACRETKSSLLSLYLKDNCIGKVHSKFKKGLNVQFGETLIYISFIGTPLSAFGLNIEEEKLLQILNSTCIGDLVANKDNRLTFYSINGISSIEYKNMHQVDLSLPKVNYSIAEVPNSRLYHYLQNIEFEKLIGIELDNLTLEYIRLLLSSDKEDLNINSSIINFFSGRGKGLTPSGDDILIGFTIALMIFDKTQNWMKALEAGIKRNTTTMTSVAYLRALLEGHSSEYFIQLINLLDEEQIDSVEAVIKKIQSFGHTSGNDTLFGFFLGLKFLMKNEAID